MWQRWVRRGLLALSVLIAASLIYILITRSEIASSPSTERLTDVPEAGAAMQQFTFLQSQDGAVKWEVRAERARLQEADSRAILESVQITLYGKKGRELTLEGEQGIINTETRDFEVANKTEPLAIEVNGGYTIYTNKIHWNDKRQEFRTEEPVKIVGSGLQVTGVGLVGNLDSEEYHIEHDVEFEVEP